VTRLILLPFSARDVPNGKVHRLTKINLSKIIPANDDMDQTFPGELTYINRVRRPACHIGPDRHTGITCDRKRSDRAMIVENPPPSVNGAELINFAEYRSRRLADDRRRAAWNTCVRASRAVDSALRRAEQATKGGDSALASLYVDQARRRARVATRLLESYEEWRGGSNKQSF